MNSLIYAIGLAILILIAWLVFKHGFGVVIFGLGAVASLFTILALTAYFIPKPATGELKKCVDACQLAYKQCGQECYLKSSGYKMKTCFDNCSQVLDECFSVCEKEKAVK